MNKTIKIFTGSEGITLFNDALNTEGITIIHLAKVQRIKARINKAYKLSYITSKEKESMFKQLDSEFDNTELIKLSLETLIKNKIL